MSLNPPVVVVGLGELGAFFAGGFLRLGFPVVPVLRGISSAEVARQFPTPALILVAVGENDLDPALSSLPRAYRGRAALLQNELLPRDWERHGLEQPSIMVVWFEKKPNRPVTSLLPSAVYGPNAELLARVIAALGLPARKVDSRAELELELVSKNLYILSINLAGLRTGGTVGELRNRHGAFFASVVDEIIALQEALLGRELPREQLRERLDAALDADPNHVAMGRSAPIRLARALAQARALGLALPTLAELPSSNQ